MTLAHSKRGASVNARAVDPLAQPLHKPFTRGSLGLPPGALDLHNDANPDV